MKTDALLVAFDLDDTLAPSKTAIDPRIGDLLIRLLDVAQVCVISGGQITQFRTQLLEQLPTTDETVYDGMHLMPTCGTQYYRHDGGAWYQVYAENLTDDERERALAAVETEARRLNLWETDTWGPILEDRGSQITYSALGQHAPVTAKTAWDPTGERKSTLRDAVQRLLPDLEVRSGGSTSVDITRRGIDKAYGMSRLAEATNIPLNNMLFVGDRLDPDGNDYPVLTLGVECHAVDNWTDTAEFLEQLIPKMVAEQR